MDDQPLLTFKSKIEGKNADVAIYVDRVEWKKRRGSEVIPVRAISSVTIEKSSFTMQQVKVICSGNTIEFRVNRAEAEQIRNVLTQVVLGNHPAQQTVAPAPPPSPPTPTDDLVKLAELHRDGTLTDDEFATAKARLLGVGDVPPPPPVV